MARWLCKRSPYHSQLSPSEQIAQGWRIPPPKPKHTLWICYQFTNCWGCNAFTFRWRLVGCMYWPSVRQSTPASLSSANIITTVLAGNECTHYETLGDKQAEKRESWRKRNAGGEVKVWACAHLTESYLSVGRSRPDPAWGTSWWAQRVWSFSRVSEHSGTGQSLLWRHARA